MFLDYTSPSNCIGSRQESHTQLFYSWILIGFQTDGVTTGNPHAVCSLILTSLQRYRSTAGTRIEFVLGFCHPLNPGNQYGSSLFLDFNIRSNLWGYHRKPTWIEFVLGFYHPFKRVRSPQESHTVRVSSQILPSFQTRKVTTRIPQAICSWILTSPQSRSISTGIPNDTSKASETKRKKKEKKRHSKGHRMFHESRELLTTERIAIGNQSGLVNLSALKDFYFILGRGRRGGGGPTGKRNRNLECDKVVLIISSMFVLSTQCIALTRPTEIVCGHPDRPS